MKDTHWYDKQQREDAKIAKRLQSIQNAFSRLTESTDLENMDRDHALELLLMEKQVKALLEKYKK